ncbi:dTDP-4-dehydrorhamnose 3,5-epimerase family protein [Opitutales bacterium]|nr:dTDP-4-dehydrorhamnose 3,5-epimerase family protein [Opitutales bacterium]
MIVEKTQLDGVLKIKLDAFEDHRGWYVETYNEQKYHGAGIDIKFVEDDISVTRKNCLKGVHGDQDTWKLISCINGSFYLAVVNNEPTHPQFRQSQGFTLSDRNNIQILVPPKFGNGHVALTETSVFQYKQSSYYNPKGQFTIIWNDPEYNIWWPIKSPTLSQRDENGKFIF